MQLHYLQQECSNLRKRSTGKSTTTNAQACTVVECVGGQFRDHFFIRHQNWMEINEKQITDKSNIPDPELIQT